MSSRKKIVVGISASFGVAMASTYIASDMQAEILDVTWNGDNPTASAAFSSSSTTLPVTQSIDQIAGIYGFAQWNDQLSGTGRTIAVFTSMVPPGLVSVTEVSEGQVLDPETFIGYGAGDGSQFDGSGSAFIGFRSLAGNVGWFRIDFVQAGPITYSTGQYGNAGEPVTAGGKMKVLVGDVNCDDLIDLLDVQPFVALLIDGGFEVKADIDGDGVITLLDVQPFVDLILGNP